MNAKLADFKPLALPSSDAAHTMSSRMVRTHAGPVMMSQADPTTWEASISKAAVAAAASSPNAQSATRRAVDATDRCAATAREGAEILSAQAAQAHQAGYKKVAAQLNAVAAQLKNSGKEHEQQAALLRTVAGYVEQGKPELAGFAGITGPVPAQSVIAGINPMVFRAAGALYGYYVASTFLVSEGDPNRMAKLAAFTALGAFSPVFGSMGMLLYANLRRA